MDETLNKGDIRITREKRRSGFLFLVIFIVLTLGIGVTGYFYYETQAKQLRDAVNDQLSAVADLKVKQIVAWRNERVGDAAVIFKNPIIVSFVHQYLDNPGDPVFKEKLSRWINIIQKEYDYKYAFLADAQGNTRISFPEKHTNPSTHIRPHFSEAIRTRKIIFVDFHFDPDEHVMNLALVIPLCESSARGDTAPFGVMVLEIDPYQFLYPLIQTWPTPSKTAETLLVRREGNEVVFLNELRHRKNTALTLRFPISRKDLTAVMAVEGKTGVVEGVDYRGKPVVGAIRAVPGSPWYLVSKIDQDEITSGIKKQTRLLGIIFSLLFFLSGTIMLFVWRHQRTLFYKKQFETERKLAIERKRAENELAQSHERLINLLDSINSLVYVADFYSHEILFLNKYGRDMFGDMRGQKCWQAIQKGKKGPCSFCTNNRLLSDAGIPTGVYQWEFQNTINGKWFECRDQAISWPGKGLVRMEVATDITERKRVEDRIRKLNQLQALLLDPDILEKQLKKITDGVVDIFNADFCRIWLIDRGDRCDTGCAHAAITEGPHVCRYRDKCLHLVASSGRYTHLDGETHCRVPFGCYKIGGIASGEDSSFLTNDITNDPRVHNHEWAKQLGLVSFAGFQLRPPHGETKGVLALFSQSPISDEEYSLLESVSNLTMRAFQTAQAQEELKGSERKFRTIFDSANDGMFLLDLETRKFVMCNKMCSKMLGFTQEEFLNLVIADLHPSEDLPFIFEKIGKFLENGVGGVRADIRFRRKDGTVFFTDLSPALMTLAGRKFALVVFNDITERKRAEGEIKKYYTLFETSTDAIMMLTQDGSFFDGNKAAFELFGFSSKDDFIKMHPSELSPPTQPDGKDSLTASLQHIETALAKGADFFEWVHKKKDGILFSAGVRLSSLELGGRVVLQGLVRDITERKRAEAEREKLIVELRASLEKVKTLSGLLPICASCKKIRDDKGYWNQIESYIRDHSEAEFSHGICPECMKKLYPDFDIVE